MTFLYPKNNDRYMIDISTFNILLTLLVVLMPLFGLLAKDGSKLYRSIAKALEDGTITNDEMKIIIDNTGVVLRSIVILIDKTLFYWNE